MNLQNFCAQNDTEWNTFLFLLSPTWEFNIVAAEVGLTEAQVEKYNRAMKQVTLIELVSYLAVFGVKAIKKGPTRFLQLFLNEEEDITNLFTYLTHTRNRRTWIENMIEVFDSTGPNKLQHAWDGRYEGLIAWVYSTLVNTSGLLSGPKEENRATMNMIPERDRAAGFLFPKQMPKRMMAERKDWMTALAPSISLIYGYMV